MARSRRYWGMLGVVMWMAAGMLGCAGEEIASVATVSPRATEAKKASHAASTSPAPVSPTAVPSTKWTVPPVTPSPTQAPFRPPIPQESVAIPDPDPTSLDIGLEPPVEDSTPSP